MKKGERIIFYSVIIFLLLIITYILQTNFFEPSLQFKGFSDNSSYVLDEFKDRIRLLPSDNGTEHTIRPLHPSRWRQRTFQSHGSYLFVQYSAYRFSAKIIHILGIGDVVFTQDQLLGACTWHGDDGHVIIGKLHITVDDDTHLDATRKYGARMYKCIFETETGNGGGHLVGDINGEENVLFREEANMIQSMGEDEAFEFNHTYCTAPLHGRLHAKMIWQWIEYHRVLFDADSFVFYHVDYDMAALMPYIQSYVDKGSVEIIDFSDILAFKVWYYGQLLAAWDCVHRYAFKSKWIFLHDFDEYLQVYPPHTLPSILQQNKDKVWLSHGMITWDVKMCIRHSPSSSSSSSLSVDDVMKEGKVVMDYEEEFGVERMLYRNIDVYCSTTSYHPHLCLSWRGHRKLIVNPRKVIWIRVHNVMFSDGRGVDMNASSEMAHNHFRGLHSFNKKIFCSKLYEEDYGGNSTLIRDDSVAAMASFVRSCLKDSTHCAWR